VGKIHSVRYNDDHGQMNPGIYENGLVSSEEKPFVRCPPHVPWIFRVDMWGRPLGEVGEREGRGAWFESLQDAWQPLEAQATLLLILGALTEVPGR
jgi:hypothetical protein